VALGRRQAPVMPTDLDTTQRFEVGSDRRDGRAIEREIEPDARFTFANERTFLAWNRTALALIAGGLVGAQYLKVGPVALRTLVCLLLVLLGMCASFGSYRLWRSNERALRLGQPLAKSVMPYLLAHGIAAFAVAAGVAVVVHLAS
jgi:putative membrane protein